MPTVSSVSRPRGHDHFVPEAALDPETQRKMRGYLEHIDYATYAANRDVLGKALSKTDSAAFEKLATAAACARAEWIATAIAITQKGGTPSGDDIARMGAKRHAFEELSEAYEALRRAVERGYLRYNDKG